MKMRRCKVVVIITFAVLFVETFRLYHLLEYPQRQKEEEVFRALDSQKYKINDLIKQNRDIVGWIEIPETTISYPIMQTKSNPDFYLDHNFYRAYSFYGTPYLDSRCDLNSTNLFIYGHNINRRRMFGALLNYTSREFYRKHKRIHFIMKDSEAWYEIVAVVKCDGFSPWYAFVNAKDEEEYAAKIKFIISNSIFQCDADSGSKLFRGKSRQLLTLSTCGNHGENSRFLVVGIKLR